MIIKLDKGDTQEIFKEFVDEATKNYMNSKIKSLFDQRVDKMVEDKLKDLDLEKMILGQLSVRLDRYFKSDWHGEMDFANKRIDEKLKEIDLKKIVEGKFTENVAEAVWGRMRMASKTVEAL